MNDKNPTSRDTLPVEWCVAGTLAWFGVLGRALRVEDLGRLLLKRKVTRREIEQALDRMESKVRKRDRRYWVKGATIRPPTGRATRAYHYKWWRVRVAAGLLRHLPFVRMVAVGNTLADRTADTDSDVDLFIIAERGRLFTVRLLVTATLQAFGLRRHGTKVANRMCLSFWVTTEHLDLSDIAFPPYDIYLAYWITDLKPVIDCVGTHRAFLDANRWVGELVPAYAAEYPAATPSRFAGWLERRLIGKIGERIESRLKRRQLARIDTAPRKDEPDVRIVASETMLKFHEKERRKIYRQEWEVLMRTLGFDPERIR